MATNFFPRLNKNGATICYKDQDGLGKQYERDAFGRVVKETFPDNTQVQYAYTELGRLENVIDQSGHEIKFAWNKHGLDSRTTAVGQITQNYYDEYGRLVGVDSQFEGEKSDRSFSYKYDDLDRLVGISYGSSQNETLKYDTWGKVIEKSKNGLVSKFKYDHFGRLVEKSEGGAITKYAYDNYGKRLSRVLIKGKEVLDEYNTYDKFGRIVKKLGPLAGNTLFDKDGKLLSELKYFYTKSGKLTSRLANGKLQEYKYDAKNQLLAVIDMESKSAVEEYVYDASGNILKKTINGETTTYTYDAANQLVNSIAPDGRETKYAYDAAGRMIREGDKTYEYGWLDKVTLANFEYHNNGQIAKAKRENGVETFEWDGLALIERNGIKYIEDCKFSIGILYNSS